MQSDILAHYLTQDYITMAKTLLITDDAAIIRAKIKEVAIGGGWMIVGEARNGKEAVERYAELHPTVMTVDLVMPEYDGIYALREILAMDPNAKVVVIRRDRTEAHPQRRFQIGAADFVVKPFDKAMLHSKRWNNSPRPRNPWPWGNTDLRCQTRTVTATGPPARAHNQWPLADRRGRSTSARLDNQLR